MRHPLADKILNALKVEPLSCFALARLLGVRPIEASYALLQLAETREVHSDGEHWRVGPGVTPRISTRPSRQLPLRPGHTASDFVAEDEDEPLYDVRGIDLAFADSDQRLADIASERPSGEV